MTVEVKASGGLLEIAFEHKYFQGLGWCYECKVCQTILKTSYDALMHVMHFHKCKKVEDFQSLYALNEIFEELRQSVAKDRDEEERKPKPKAEKPKTKQEPRASTKSKNLTEFLKL